MAEWGYNAEMLGQSKTETHRTSSKSCSSMSDVQGSGRLRPASFAAWDTLGHLHSPVRLLLADIPRVCPFRYPGISAHKLHVHSSTLRPLGLPWAQQLSLTTTPLLIHPS